MSAAAVNLCSGAGGWEVAADELGLDVLGVELDDAPIAVARAAGHRVLQADIAALDPLDFAPCPGLIASVPCPTFSSAGRGAGRALEDVICECLTDLAEGNDTREYRRVQAYEVLEPDTAHFDVLPLPRRRRKREQYAASPVDRDRIARREAKRATARRDAAISLLVVEPLRWALALEPRWVALEQVPPVLPIWQAMAAVLRERGYSVWTGVMLAERYGRIATCPIHDQRSAPDARSPFTPTNLASAATAGIAVAGLAQGDAANVRQSSTIEVDPGSADRAATKPSMSDQRCLVRDVESRSGARGPASAEPVEMPWAEWLASAENAHRLSTFSTDLASVGHAGTGAGIGSILTGALSDAWSVASLARASMDDASDATWSARVRCLLSRALPARRTPRGRAADGWTSAAMSGDGWTAADGENITWSPSVFWAALCAEAKSYITPTSCPTTTTPTTSGSSRPTATTCTTTTAERSRASCSLCDDMATPQTRQRAILIASLDREVREPPATHQRYIAPRKRAADVDTATLFEAPVPERIVHREDRDLLPWVSMAEALSWGMTARPSVTLSAKEGQTGGNRPLEAGSGARDTLDRARADGEWVDGPSPSPSPSVTAGGTGSGGGVEVFAGREARERAANAVEWRQRSNYSDSGPADTTAEERSDVWVTHLERPSTSVNCDPRVAEPGRHDPDESGSQYGPQTVRVSVEEAAALQSFPRGYPWEAAGTRTAAFKAVGNAIPCLLALHVLAMATGVPPRCLLPCVKHP